MTVESITDPARLLRERAQRLAEPPVAPTDHGRHRPVLRFVLGGVTHAVDLHHVAEVLPLRGMTPIPGAPVVFLGVVYVRGRILAVADGRRLLGLPPRDPDAHSQIVRLAIDGFELGLLVDGDAVVDAIGLETMGLPLPGSMAQAGLVEGVTAAGVVVIDAGRLAVDSRVRASAMSRVDADRRAT